MNPDNKNTMIGLVLIVAILIGWNFLMMPSSEQLAEQKRIKDSTELATRRADSLKIASNPTTAANGNPSVSDSIRKQQLAVELGDFAKLAIGTEQLSVVENQDLQITFTNKGGKIRRVWLKKYKRFVEHPENRQEEYLPLYLMEDDKNRFGITIPTNTPTGSVSTENLYFAPSVSGNTITFRAALSDAVVLEQKYTLGGSYDLDYSLKINGLPMVLKSGATGVQLNFENYLDKIEKNVSYERNYSFLQYKLVGDSRDYLSASKADSKDLQKPVEWISNAHQFFNTTFIAPQGGFKSALVSTDVYEESVNDLKKMTTRLEIPADQAANGYTFKMYIGPNDYNTLAKYNNKMEEIVDYGGSILGTINRFLIRPIFDFLHSLIGNVAICILLLTLIVKGFLYPLSYKMLTSQAKTTALKPEIEKLKVKFKDDKQRVQTETMKLYGEYGVNPLGGCLPTLLQMPIWMALFRFFPANIAFRQEGFLWAKDLTGYEEFIKLPFHLPMYGAHVSLFALLWGVSLIFFTWYTMKDTDMSSQPAGMKQLQYFSPILFMVVFNSYAAGLSLYMLFSNILNIAQTIVTKQYIINHDAIRAKLEDNKKKPKKKSAFRQRLDEAMQQQEASKQQGAKKK